MSAEATRYVWERGRLSRHRIILALAHLSTDRVPPFRCAPGHSTLSSLLGLSAGSVKRALGDLVEDGTLTISSPHSHTKPTTYSIQ